MKKLKKILTMLLVIAMAFSLFLNIGNVKVKAADLPANLMNAQLVSDSLRVDLWGTPPTKPKT